MEDVDVERLMELQEQVCVSRCMCTCVAMFNYKLNRGCGPLGRGPQVACCFGLSY